MFDRKRVLLLVAAAAVSLASLVTAAIDVRGRETRTLETRTASSRSRTAPPCSALANLEGAARKRPTTVMCAEAVWWRCHRRLIADALTARGWRVEHLGVGERPPVHALPEFALVDSNGTITYPHRQATLLEPEQRR